jgi:cytochrome P450
MMLRAPGQLIYVHCNPDVNVEICNDRAGAVTHELQLDGFSQFAKGLVALEGETWRRHRRLCTRAFFPDSLRVAAAAASHASQAFVQRMRAFATAHGGGTTLSCEFAAEVGFMHCYMDILGHALLSTDFNAIPDWKPSVRASTIHNAAILAVREAAHCIDTLERLPRRLWPVMVPRRTWTQLSAAKEVLASIADGVIARKLGDGTHGEPVPASAASAATSASIRRVGCPLTDLDMAPPDLASALLGTRDGSGDSLSAAEVRDELMLFIMGASETSAKSTAWVLYALALDAAGVWRSVGTPSEPSRPDDLSSGVCSHARVGRQPLTDYTQLFEYSRLEVPPPWICRVSSGGDAEPARMLSVAANSLPPCLPTVVQRETGAQWSRVWTVMEAEIAREVGLDVGLHLRMEQLDRLVYVAAVIREAMRLFPAIPATARKLTAARRVGADEIPAGAYVVALNVPLHTNPRLYPNPLRFVPERWLSAEQAAVVGGDACALLATHAPTQRNAFNNFGCGPKSCIGRAFAELQIKAVLVRLVQQCCGVRLAAAAPPVVPCTRPSTGARNDVIVALQMR